MTDRIEIRESLPSELKSLEKIYRRAFPDEDLVPLLRSLLGAESGVLSLVAIAEAAPVGHVVFTPCGVSGSAGTVALLGPLCVAPAWQRQGFGSALVRAGLRQQGDAGVNHVYVLGDPAYYARFGFQPDHGVQPPYPLPEEWRGAWQSLSLHPSAPPLRGTLSVPRPWRQPALWGP